MSSMDGFIREIQNHELVEIEGCLDASSLKRIEGRILQEVLGKQENSAKKRGHKKWLVLALTAVLLMGLGITVAAAKEHEWDIELIRFMGIKDINTFQLESGEVQINQGQKSMCVDYGSSAVGEEKEIEMRAVSAIGDKNEVYIRMETDYVLPEDFDPATDYVLPKDYNLSISPNNGYGATFTYFAEDNKLGFLMAISNCEDVNKATISIHMEDLVLYHDLNASDSDSSALNQGDSVEEETLLCSGAWDLEWTFNYKSHTKTYHKLHKFQSEGVDYYLTKIEISPISIRMEAFCLPGDYKEIPQDWLEKICFSDGTELLIEDMSSAGIRNRMFAESYVGIEQLGGTIEPKKVKKLVIGGEEVKVN